MVQLIIILYSGRQHSLLESTWFVVVIKIYYFNFWVMHSVALVPIKLFLYTSVRYNICGLKCITSATCFGPDRWPSSGDSQIKNTS
jgi:hypothetical protein